MKEKRRVVKKKVRPQKPIYDIVFVEWMDACSGGQGWYDLQAHYVEPVYNQSIGFLTRQNKEFINVTLTGSVDSIGSQSICIPNAYIRNITVLKKGVQRPIRTL